MNRKNMIFTLGVLAAALALSGCGSQPYDEAAPGTQQPTVTPYSPSGDTGGSGEDDPINSELPDPTTLDFSLVGFQTKSIATVETDSILKVQVSAAQAGMISVPNINFAAQYACLQVTLNVAGASWTSKLLKVPGSNAASCPGAVDYDQRDFSYRVLNASGPFEITVGQAFYDFYCQVWDSYAFRYGPNYPQYVIGMGTRNLSCPVKSVYNTHTVKGQIKIQTNFTQPL